MQNGVLIGGRYRLDAPLGKGGTSVVWRASDEVLGCDVALKILSPKLADDATLVSRFRVEAALAARLDHPHVVGVYDFGELLLSNEKTVPYVVLELIDGQPLSAALRAGAMPWQDAVRMGAEIGAALTAAHARGIVHRDVKPDNIMLTAHGAKLLDFGISATAGESDVGPDGELLCTPAYVAPERLANGPVRPACDVYGLGLLLFRALTGEFPWACVEVAELIDAHQNLPPAKLPEVPGLPAEVADLYDRCLAKRPEDRPSSAEVTRVLAAAAARSQADADADADADAIVPEPATAAPQVAPVEIDTVAANVSLLDDHRRQGERRRQPGPRRPASPQKFWQQRLPIERGRHRAHRRSVFDRRAA